jgi:hypothetical protein
MAVPKMYETCERLDIRSRPGDDSSIDAASAIPWAKGIPALGGCG